MATVSYGMVATVLNKAVDDKEDKVANELANLQAAEQSGEEISQTAMYNLQKAFAEWSNFNNLRTQLTEDLRKIYDKIINKISA